VRAPDEGPSAKTIFHPLRVNAQGEFQPTESGERLVWDRATRRCE